jgi:SAM-dependent methyltransferase
MKNPSKEKIRESVRKSYGNFAKNSATGCGCDCGPGKNPTAEEISMRYGYSKEELSSVPEGANMGLGCGNPQAIASLKPGETVLDLGSGGGFDSFLAAKAVGEKGHVIGVDMTPEMIGKARENINKTDLNNVEFRLGEIEKLPLSSNSVDVIISNCVINLSPEKDKVYKEAFRVLKEGGRLAITDVVTTAPLPEEVKNDMALYAGCVSGAAEIEDLKSMLEEAGFKDIRVESQDKKREVISEYVPGSKIEDYIVSATIEAVKPNQ